jgi:O-antigen ligase
MVQLVPTAAAANGRPLGGAAFGWLTGLALLLAVSLGAVDGSSMGAIVPAYAVLGLALAVVARVPLGPVDRWTVALVLLFLLWMAASTALAGRGSRGLGRVGQMATVLLPLLLLLPLARPAERTVRRLIGAVAAVAAVVAAALGLELLLDAPLAQALWSQNATRYNRGLACLVILVWPLAAAAGPRLALPLLVAVGFMAGASESATARLAFAVGSVVALAALVLPRVTVAAIAAGSGLLLLAAPVVFHGIEWVMPLTREIPASWIERLDIWREATTVIAGAPWTGHGLRMMRDVAPLPPVMSAYTHLHNVLLQLWLDLGFVGAAVAFALALRLLLLSRRLDAAAVPFAAAAWTAALVTVMSGFEVWSEAMLGMFAFAAFLFAASARAAPGR